MGKNTKKSEIILTPKHFVAMVVIVAAIAVAATFGTVKILQYRDEQKVAEQEKQKEEQTEIESELSNILKDDSATISDIEELYKKDLPKLDEKTATNYIDSLAYLVYINISEYDLSSAEEQLVAAACDEKGDYKASMLSDETLASKLDEMQKIHAYIGYRNGGVVANVDYKYFIDTYGEYMKDDYKSIFSLYSKEQSEDYYDSASKTYHMDVLVDRIKSLNTSISEFSDSELLDVYKDSLDFYLQIYFGGYNNTPLFDDSGVLNSYVKESYESCAKDEKNPISQYCLEILSLYEASGDKWSDDVETYVYKISNHDSDATDNSTDTDQQTQEDNSDTEGDSQTVPETK